MSSNSPVLFPHWPGHQCSGLGLDFHDNQHQHIPGHLSDWNNYGNVSNTDDHGGGGVNMVQPPTPSINKFVIFVLHNLGNFDFEIKSQFH